MRENVYRQNLLALSLRPLFSHTGVVRNHLICKYFYWRKILHVYGYRLNLVILVTILYVRPLDQL